MRLTLRTLLAYLDDVLEPAETKLIGQKIQESAVAGKLISLIRLVVRQRRLKAPSVSGPNIGIDPNVIAQYLDNTLAPEQVVEVEKILLTSDELLAEVASCHQVLALIMGKHVDVSDASRERLYALGPVATSEQLHVEVPAVEESSLAETATREADRVTQVTIPVEPSPAPPEVPEYLRQPSWTQRIVPTALMALLIFVCAGLLYLDPGLLPGLQQAKRELAKVDRDIAKPVTTPKSNSDTASQSSTENGSNDETQADATLKPSSENDLASTTSPVGQMSDRDLPPAPSGGSQTNPRVKPAAPIIAPNGVDALAELPLASKIPPSPTGPTPNPPPSNIVDNPVLPKAMEVQYISNDGVVMRWDENKQHWYQMPRRSIFRPGERIAVPEPFEAVVDFDHGAILGTVLGDSSFRLLGPNATTRAGVQIHRGRYLLRSFNKDLTEAPSLTIEVGAEAFGLVFQSPDTTCAIEISPREPVQFEKPYDEKWYVGLVRVLSGTARWTTPDGVSQEIGAQKAVEIVPSKSIAGVRPAPVSFEYTPEWTDSQKRKQPTPLRKSGVMFEKQFELDQPIEQSLMALIKDPHAKISELAIRSLGLIEAPAVLVQALAECDFEEGRFAARDGIRLWLGRSADRGPILKAALETHFPAPEANAAYIMLWGFRPEDASNRGTSIELVMWLRSSHIAVRELAYYWITQLTNRKWDYRAMDVQARRDAAIRKLEAHVNKDQALVKPSSKDTGPTPKAE